MPWARTRTAVNAQEGILRDICVPHGDEGGKAMLTGKFVVSGCFGAILGLLTAPALAQNAQTSFGGRGGGCNSLPGWSALKGALTGSITASSGGNGGLGFNMWGVIVDNSGIVCAVAFSGGNFTYQWLASRGIAAPKAKTAISR